MRKIIKWALLVVALACAALPTTASQASSSSGAAPSAHPSSKRGSSGKSTKKRHSRQPPSQKAPDHDRISEIQSALTKGGYYQGDSTGKWDSNTVAAVQKFQSANGLESTGKLDAHTLQMLGLGSEIAGVSAPKPIVRASPDSAPSSTPSAQPQSSTPSTRATSSDATIASAAPPNVAGPPR
jgi:peptidoglycan hydrolase-like protein with peptidoglycan-binding domain